jgi:hypothetical protein
MSMGENIQKQKFVEGGKCILAKLSRTKGEKLMLAMLVPQPTTVVMTVHG